MNLEELTNLNRAKIDEVLMMVKADGMTIDAVERIIDEAEEILVSYQKSLSAPDAVSILAEVVAVRPDLLELKLDQFDEDYGDSVLDLVRGVIDEYLSTLFNKTLNEIEKITSALEASEEPASDQQVG